MLCQTQESIATIKLVSVSLRYKQQTIETENALDKIKKIWAYDER